MKKKISSIIIGLMIFAIGIGILGKAIFDWQFTIFFDGWWALLLTVAFLFMIINEKPNVFNVFGLIIFGFIFARYYIPILEDINIWTVMCGILVLSVGVHVIWNAVSQKTLPAPAPFDSHGTENSSTGASSGTSDKNSCAFSSGESNYGGRMFSGGNFSCAFGSYRIDLRGATISSGALLNADCAFGEIKIIVPHGVSVRLSKDSFFAAVNCQAPISGTADLIIDADCAFGAINIIVA